MILNLLKGTWPKQSFTNTKEVVFVPKPYKKFTIAMSHQEMIIFRTVVFDNCDISPAVGF